MLYDGKHSSELLLLGAFTRETTVAYLEERISNFSKEPVGNGETTAWSGFTDFSQQSLELGMDSFLFFTLQTGKQMFRGSLSFPMQSWTQGWIAASLCIRSPAPPSWYRHWNKCTRTSPAILPVPHAEWQNSSLLGLHYFTSNYIVSYSDVSEHTKQKAAALETERSKLQGTFGMLCSQTFAGVIWSTYHILDWHCCFG